MTSGILIRRANINDLDALRRLWRTCCLPVEELEKQFHEFQVVENSTAGLIGTLGLRIQGEHGYLYGEAFEDFSLSDRLRPQLWDRLLVVARNHGLFRIWTTETAPFWKQTGFAPPPAAMQNPFSGTFPDTPSANWLMFSLRDEKALGISLDKELALFREAQKAETDRLHEQARMAKGIAIGISFMLALFVLVGGFLLLKRSGSPPGRSPQRQSPPPQKKVTAKPSSSPKTPSSPTNQVSQPKPSP